MGAATSRRGLLRAFVGGVAAAAAGTLLPRTVSSQQAKRCTTVAQCAAGQLCLNGVCVSTAVATASPKATETATPHAGETATAAATARPTETATPRAAETATPTATARP